MSAKDNIRTNKGCLSDMDYFLRTVILMWPILTLLAFQGATTQDLSMKFKNASEAIERLLDGYDIRLRPDFAGDPLSIGIEVILASFDAISEVNMDYTITMYLNQYWEDNRLAFSSNETDSMTLSGDFAEKIWVPDTFFANDKNSFLHDVTEKNKMIRLFGNGSIIYGMRFTTTLACMMDLHHYPLDVQNCTVEIESYGYAMSDVELYWRTESVHNVDNVELPQFDVVEYKAINKIESLLTGKYQRLSLSFKLQRNIGYFVFQTYLPSILIVMLSWVSFWINHEATSARVALGITTVLTMTTISNGVRSSLPRISYIKAIDIYLVMCFVFVFAALLEYAAVNYTYWGARAKRKAKKVKDGGTTNILRGPGIDRNSKEMEQETCIEEANNINISPLPAIRKSYQHVFNFETEVTNEPPVIRMAPVLPRTCVAKGYTPNSLLRRRNGNLVQKRKLLSTVKQTAKILKPKLPVVRDVNVIDKYARLLFPLLFIVFNITYWGYYLIKQYQSHR
nr:gamma-aminobutyric acid type A neuroreceptor beta subunit [Ruditapes philippinarum]